MQVQGQAAVVSGGASGMGAATARALAAAGAKVAVLDLDEDKAAAVAEEIDGLALACNVADEHALARALETAAAAHGPARIAVACAGIAPAGRVVGRDGPHALDLFRRVIDVNLIGTFNLLRLAAADMAELAPLPGGRPDDPASGERGVFIATASIAAWEGQIGQAAYAASKGGVVGLILPAARELARQAIRVMGVAPGLVETPMLAGMAPEVQEALIATTLHPKRLGRPEEFARLVLHICDNAMLNGSVIRLDGAVRLAPR